MTRSSLPSGLLRNISVICKEIDRHEGETGCAAGKPGLAESREKAKAVIMEGKVFVKGQREDKAGAMFDEAAPIEIHGQKLNT